MATRYWVGGDGTWNSSSTTNWSTTSGGAGGASAPTSTDDVVFDTGSGGGATSYYFVSADTGATCQNMTVGRVSATVGVVFQQAGAGVRSIAISGNFSVINSNLCVFNPASGGNILELKFTATTSGKTISVPINIILCSLNFDGVGGVWSITNIFGITTSTTDSVKLTNGELNLNSTVLTTGNFSSSNTNVRVLTCGSGTGGIALYGTTFDCTVSTNLTVNNGATSQIYFIQIAGTKLFAGGGKTWGLVSVPGTSVTVTGSNTFSSTFSSTLSAGAFVPMTLTFAAGSTQTFLSGIRMVGSGTGSRIVINSSVPGTQATLSQANGLPLTVDYANIKDLNATGGQSWVATNSVDSGNNTGWAFPVASRGSMMIFC